MLSESKSQFLDSLKIENYKSAEEIAEVVKKEGISPYDCLEYVLNKRNELFSKSLSETDNGVAIVKSQAKDIPLKVMELLEGKDYQQSQLILNACQDMIKRYSSVSLKDSNASSNTLGANVNCSTDPS